MKTPEEIVDDSGILLTKNAIEAGIQSMLCTTSYVITDLKRPLMALCVSGNLGRWKLYSVAALSARCFISRWGSLLSWPYWQRTSAENNYDLYRLWNFPNGCGRNKSFHRKKELLDIGKEIVKTSYGHDIPLYNRERTICDLIRSRNRFEIQDFQTALKTYIMGKTRILTG